MIYWSIEPGACTDWTALLDSFVTRRAGRHIWAGMNALDDNARDFSKVRARVLRSRDVAQGLVVYASSYLDANVARWSEFPGTAAELGESPNGVDRFAFIKTLTGGSIRHMGLHLDGNTLLIFYSVIGDTPERILLSTIRLDQGAPASWELSAPIEVLRSTTAYEGVNFPMTASVKGPATNVHQLRDPYVFVDNGKTYLYYGIAGESGIAVAEVHYQIIP